MAALNSQTPVSEGSFPSVYWWYWVPCVTCDVMSTWTGGWTDLSVLGVHFQLMYQEIQLVVFTDPSTCLFSP